MERPDEAACAFHLSIGVVRLRWSRRHISYLSDGDPREASPNHAAPGGRDANAGSGSRGLPHGVIAGDESDHFRTNCNYPRINPDANRYPWAEGPAGNPGNGVAIPLGG